MSEIANEPPRPASHRRHLSGKESAPAALEPPAVVNDDSLTVMGDYHYATSPIRRGADEAAVHKPENRTGLPDHLKTGVEQLSGVALDHIKVHYNSSSPAQIKALAYAQGSVIHLGPGQERHLPHEAWHLVQQACGRVKPTMQAKGMAINNDRALEREADVMGERANRFVPAAGRSNPAEPHAAQVAAGNAAPIQAVFARDEEAAGKFTDLETGLIYDFVLAAPGYIAVRRVDDGHIVYLHQTADGLLPFDQDEEAALKRRTIDVGMKGIVEEPPDSGDYVDMDEGGIEQFLEQGFDEEILDFAFSQAEQADLIGQDEDEQEYDIHMTSEFGSQVALVPIAQGESAKGSEHQYLSDDLLVSDVNVGDKDRPDTRFGAKQESHTVAWVLLRHTLMTQNGRTVRQVAEFLFHDIDRIAEMEQSESVDALLQQVARIPEAFERGRLPVFVWQQLLSRLVVIYTQIYQASRAATFRKGSPKGHGESHAIALLSAAQVEAAGDQVIDDPDRIDALTKACGSLLDIAFNPSLGAEAASFSIRHWMAALQQVFPALMAQVGEQLTGPVLLRKIPKKTAEELGATSVSELLVRFGHVKPNFKTRPMPNLYLAKGNIAGEHSMQIPSDIATNFVANVDVAPFELTGTGTLEKLPVQVDGRDEQELEVFAYPADALEIREVSLSDRDRPKTRFLRAQLSHTVAWTLVRNMLMEFSGKSARSLLHYIGESLEKLEVKNDDGAQLQTLARSRVKQLWVARLPLHTWQALLSNLMRVYVTLSQLAESSSYNDVGSLSRATGHAEGYHMGLLRVNEARIIETGKLSHTPKEIIKSANALFDAQIGDKMLSTEAFVTAAIDWMGHLRHRFPQIMSIGEQDIVSELAKRTVP
ncbi:eCIS core domain-containing protein, partial [Collimonas silvisoli]|uniref:eCIS core domain-containing protein n=1 Tax=Collimonas silvisoli TaxID=2825884 RepID=UPI001B8BC4D3